MGMRTSQPDRENGALFDAAPRIAEIRAENHQGDVSATEIEWLCHSLEITLRELRQANFFRDKLAERLGLVETAALELDCALSFDSKFDPEHWRHHVISALDLCRRATRKRGDSDA